jgi:hypothetical protein
MSSNNINPLLLGAAATIIGFGLAYLIFKKLIFDKYGGGKERANRAYYWCGWVGMIAFGQGAGTVINELFFSISNNSSINVDVVTRGVFTAIFFPAMLAVAALASSKFSRIPRNSEESRLENPSEATTKRTFHEAQGGNRNILIMLIFIFLFAFGYLIYGGKVSLAKEKKFEIIECTTCNKMGATNSENCSIKNHLKYFIVGESKVVFYGVNSDGQPVITEFPAADQKCIFNSSRKFSFVCSSNSISAQSKSSSSSEFDGEKIYQSNGNFHVFLNGDYRLITENKARCEVKG